MADRDRLYLATIAGTTVILIMAANTAFADFPRLGALQAGDGFLPRQLTYRGSRLVFSRGIMALALIASLLIIRFSGQRYRADSAVCHWRISVLYPIPDRHGPALVESGPFNPGQEVTRSGVNAALRVRLENKNGD